LVPVPIIGRCIDAEEDAESGTETTDGFILGVSEFSI